MNTPQFFQGPTLTNPNALVSVRELRDELWRVNALATEHAIQAAALREVLAGMAKEMGPIIKAYIAGNGAAALNAIGAFAAKHCKVAMPPAGGVQ